MSDGCRSRPTPTISVDVVIVGAGLAGLYMLHRIRRLGLSARVVEAGSDVGGTWYWNRYPGARCDVESLDYCYGFSAELLDEWEWSERFATQPEILAYIDHVADRFDLRRDVDFDTRVIAAHFDEDDLRWWVATDRGTSYSARFCIMATGCLSLSYVPPYEDVDRFRGQWFHTGLWPHEPVSFADKQVAVIGTGSSGVQAIPQIANEAAHLYVFQRTPNFSLPARNGPPDAERARAIHQNYPSYKQRARHTYAGRVPAPPAAGPSAAAVPSDEREREFERRWQIGGTTLMGAYGDLMTNATSNDHLAEFIRRKIRETVRDPAAAAILSPTDHFVGSKRICIDSDYWATFNRDNVTLIDVRTSPIVAITETGIDTTSASVDLDIIVFATGYDAMTGPLLNIDIRGRDGHQLRDAWKDGPVTYLGLAIAGFPNLFTITGPGSPSVRANMTAAIEQHVDWIADCLAHLEHAGYATIEALPSAQNDWVRHVADVASQTLFDKANSWYLGSNIAGKPRVFMPYVGGLDVYTDVCQSVADAGYERFALEMRATEAAM